MSELEEAKQRFKKGDTIIRSHLGPDFNTTFVLKKDPIFVSDKAGYVNIDNIISKPFVKYSGVWAAVIADTPSEPIPDNKALRYNNGKTKWSLVHWKSIEPMVKVLEFGAKKYSVDNWKKGLKRDEILESMMRHMAALMDGQENDEESTINHMGHLMCNAMFYVYMKDNGFFNKQQNETTIS